jgi:hypothetical protein
MIYSFKTFKVDIVVDRKRGLKLWSDGGASRCKFVHLHEDFSQLLNGIVYANCPWYKQVLSGLTRQPGRLYKNDIILEVGGVCVAGYRLAEFYCVMSEASNTLPVVTLTCAAAGVISASLGDFLSRRSVYGSADDLLQQEIRDNVLKLSHPPATTRLPREGEVNEVDYRFRTTDAFFEMVGKGRMLEYQQFGGTWLLFISQRPILGSH